MAGFTCANDVSAREAQFGDGQWFRGKGFDSFCPVGPSVVPAAELDPSDLRIQQRLNGEVIQDARTSALIFGIPFLVSYISHVLTLEAGDIFSCGTCGGVGQGTNTFLKVGDVMETEIESLGKMRNRFLAEAA